MKPRAHCRPRLPSSVWLLLFAGALAGCAGSPPYESTLPPNLNVKTTLSSPSVLLTAPLAGSFEADMHVIALDRRCQKNFRGSVKLGAAPVSVGIPPDEPSYLVFEFSGRSLLTRGAASSTYGTVLTPRSGHQYDVTVAYVDEMYNITVYERNPRGVRREVERRALSSCKPAAT
jgi:hypothetical protein